MRLIVTHKVGKSNINVYKIPISVMCYKNTIFSSKGIYLPSGPDQSIDDIKRCIKIINAKKNFS